MTDLQHDLRAQLDGLSPGDRDRFRRRIAGAGRISDPAKRTATMAMLGDEIDKAVERTVRRRTLAPKKLSYPAELPITERRQELLDTIRDNQVVIVAGETGSGKSTQLPKMCLELGRGLDGWIGHTQPRRIAARSIAERVASELGGSIGGLVGYTVRFSDQVGEDTMVKVMTDGILLNEIHRDRRLRRYDTIIIDEAHERSLNIDFLLGYLTRLLPERPDLKVIVTSATIDTERFATHFGGAPVIEVSGRTYPVEIRYRPLDDPTSPEPRDQTQGIVDAVAELTRGDTGDVLVFCSGEREIRDAADALVESNLRHTEILPLYGRLSSAEQHRVFQAHTGRRVVIATNVAETSLTVPGIRSVVDSGTARISRYSRRTKVQRLPIEPVSQASANQRAGRCGRLGPGICIRLYDENDFNARPEFTEPEILRTNLASVMLQMAALDLGDIESYPFLDPPDKRAVKDGLALLHELGAVDPTREGTRSWLTPIGRQLAQLPLDPRLGRMVVEGDRNGCLAEVLVIASALSIQDPRERPKDEEEKAKQMHARFRHPDSDLLGILALWRHLNDERKQRTSNQFRRMCQEEFLNYRRVREWQDIHSQLRDVAKELELRPNRKPADPDQVHLSLLAGLLSHVGKKDPVGYEYRGARGAKFSLSPGSTLFKKTPEWVMAADLVETSRLWARGVAAIPLEWIEQVGAHLLNRTLSDPWWDIERGSAVAQESVTLYGIPLAADRTVQYGRFDEAASRDLFIRHALVHAEWPDDHHRHEFVLRNLGRIDEVAELEARQRRSDLLADEDRIAAVFDQKLPADVTTVAAFDRWWRETRSATPHFLDLTLDDLIDPAAALPDPEAFPDTWRHGDLAMPIEYQFDPESPSDGVVIEVPLAGLDRVDPAVFEWNVPGRRPELIEALVRSLPKAIRRQFVPIADTVDTLVAGLDPAAGAPREALRRELVRLSGTPIPPDAFDLTKIPAHLRPRFRVVDTDGTSVAEGDDLADLKHRLVADARSLIESDGHELERRGITAWDLGELPRSVMVGDAAHRTRAYPALTDEGDSVAIRLVATPDEQADAMWHGTIRLLLLNLPSAQRLLEPMLDNAGRLAIRSGPYDSPAEWVDDVLGCAVGTIVSEHGRLPWDATAFDSLFRTARDQLADRVYAVADTSLALLQTLHTVEIALGRLDIDRHAEPAADIRSQIDLLVYPGFLTAVGAVRVVDIHRYLRAVERRLDRLPRHPEADLALMVNVHQLEDEYDRLAELLPPSPEMVDIAWMLQEYRVSLYGQSLGTKGKVSEKRISQALADLVG